MSRGVALSTLRQALKGELGDAQETNTAIDAEYNLALARKQSDFANFYDWPFLEDEWDLACASGNRYLSIPTQNVRALTVAINFERPVKVERLFNSYWGPVDHGIGAAEYNVFGSIETTQQDPIRKWKMESNTGDATLADQIEIWPIPVSSQTLRFTGQRVVRVLAIDADKADLDDLLLVYSVAADYLALRQQGNAPLVLRKAQERLVKLRAGYPVNTINVVFGKRLLFNQTAPVKLIAVK